MSAGKAGVAGLSVEALIADFSRQEATISEGIRSGVMDSRHQTAIRPPKNSRQQMPAGGAASPDVQPLVASEVTRPSVVGAALQIGGDVLDPKNELDRRRGRVLNQKD